MYIKATSNDETKMKACAESIKWFYKRMANMPNDVMLVSREDCKVKLAEKQEQLGDDFEEWRKNFLHTWRKSTIETRRKEIVV